MILRGLQSRDREGASPKRLHARHAGLHWNLAQLLIVDDDANTLASLSRAFRLAGHQATVCDNAARALELIEARALRHGALRRGHARQRRLGAARGSESAGRTTPVVMISGQANIEMAVRATRLGAIDFLEKPLSTEKLLLTIENVLRMRRLEDENRQLRQRVGKHEIVRSGEAMRRVMAQVDRVAASETRVCILGETGTGKELIARALHDRSPRRDGPFVTLNCAAVPAELIESELFGHEKGSFTGAVSRHLGKFEQAHHGTYFWMKSATCRRSCRPSCCACWKRAGGAHRRRQAHRGGCARGSGHASQPGRDGRGAATSARISIIVSMFFRCLCRRCANARRISPRWWIISRGRFRKSTDGSRSRFAEAIAELSRYGWPGNVRELRNVVERLLLLADAEVNAAAVRLALPHAATAAAAPLGGGTLAARTEAYEREVILAELKRHQRMTETAKALGLERSHLYKQCQQLGIDLRAMRTEPRAE